MTSNFSRTEPKHALMIVGAIFLSLAGVFLVLMMIGQIMSFSFARGAGASNTITVSGTGEAVATPDMAVFTFTAMNEAKDVSDAQTNVNETTNAVLDQIKALGIDESDIKTLSYNAYPRYEWNNTIRCVTVPCPTNNERVLVGYEVSQTIEVKVRDLDRTEDVVAVLGSAELDSFNGPNFSVDDDRDLYTEARADAIADAKEKAEALAKELGVKLGKLVSYSDGAGGGYEPPIMYARTEAAMNMDAVKAQSPTLPTGENEFMASVSLTYRVR